MVALARTWLSQPVLLSRASPTILHEAQTASSGSRHNDEDKPLATGFITFVGKSGGVGGRESTASPGISAGGCWRPGDSGCLRQRQTDSEVLTGLHMYREEVLASGWVTQLHWGVRSCRTTFEIPPLCPVS